VATVAPRFTQFVLEAPEARTVSLVGAFNGWNPDSTRLVRDASGIWTATIALVPGRHVYAFMVNDSVLTLDPRAPETRDPDLGTRASVVLVGAH
jgi:1,4-alpha-glucan branching enzyme